jgi:hypothetical protein
MTDIGQPLVSHMAISMHELTVGMARLRGYGTMTRSEDSIAKWLMSCIVVYDYARFRTTLVFQQASS